MIEINTHFLIDTSNQSLMQNASRALCESAATEVFRFLSSKGVPVTQAHVDEFLGGLSSAQPAVASVTAGKKLCSGKTVKGDNCKANAVKGTDRCSRHAGSGTVTVAVASAASSASGSVAASGEAWAAALRAGQVASAAAPLVGSVPVGPLFHNFGLPVTLSTVPVAATPSAVPVTPPAATPLEFTSGPPEVGDDDLIKALIHD